MLVLNTHVLQEGWHPQDKHIKTVSLKHSHMGTAVFLSLLTQPHRQPRIHLSLSHKIIHSKRCLPYRRTARWWVSAWQSTTRCNKIRRKVGSKLSIPGLTKEGHKHKYTVKTETNPPAKPSSLHPSFPSSVGRQQPPG